jgi:hypothetical protein
MFTLSQVPRLIGTINGRPVSPSTVRHWVRSGAQAHDGRRVKLAALRIGGRFALRREDLLGFLADVAGRPVRLAEEPEVACA